eukprot:757542-Hanusia_phi.AAC.1
MEESESTITQCLESYNTLSKLLSAEEKEIFEHNLGHEVKELIAEMQTLQKKFQGKYKPRRRSSISIMQLQHFALLNKEEGDFAAVDVSGDFLCKDASQPPEASRRQGAGELSADRVQPVKVLQIAKKINFFREESKETLSYAHKVLVETSQTLRDFFSVSSEADLSERIAVTFNTHDADNSGTLEVSELLTAFAEMGAPKTAEEVKILIEQFDADDNGEFDIVRIDLT